MMNTSSQLTKMKRKPFYILVHIIPDIKSRIMLDINKMIDKRLIFCILFQGLTSLTPTPNDQPQDVRSNLDRLLSDPRFDKNSEQKNDVISWIEVRNENPFFFSFFFMFPRIFLIFSNLRTVFQKLYIQIVNRKKNLKICNNLPGFPFYLISNVQMQSLK